MQRRTFINQTLATTAALRAFSNPAVHSQEPAKEDPKPVILGVMGYSRGRDMAEELIKIPGVIIKYICETDSQRGESGVRRIAEVGGKAELVSDLRRVLEISTMRPGR